MPRLAVLTFARPRTPPVPQHLLRHSHHRNSAAVSENRRRNSGEPQRMWAAPGDLPPGTLDYITAAIGNLTQKRHFSEYGWEPVIR
jgi:hypothetical protein